MQDVSVARLEAEVLVLQIGEAADQQSGGAEQDQRDGSLQHDEDFLRPESTVFGRAIRAAQGVDRVGVRGHPRRSRAKQDAGDQRNAEGKRKHRQRRRGVNGQIALPCNQVDQQARARVGNHQAGEPAEHRENHALRQRLADQPAARRAQRGTDRSLRLARRGSDQHEVGEIGAGDEQHKR